MLVLAVATIITTFSSLYMEPGSVIDDFDTDNHLEWRIVNDGVMGGLSQSTIKLTGESTAVFSGRVSLENNGGFASTRALLRDTPGEIDSIVIRVKGDGNRYTIRFRTNNRFDGPAYVAPFETKSGEWTVHDIPLSQFKAQFRGYVLNDQPPLEGDKIKQVGILISDKQEGEFKLEIDYIYGM